MVLGLLLKLIPGVGTILALAQFAVGVVYPTFQSFKAIESMGSSDDTQWLSYWVVYAVYQLVEKFLWIILAWVPLYSIAKIGLLGWLVAPQTQGATFVYTTYARPALFAVADKARTVPQLEPYVRGIGGGVVVPPVVAAKTTDTTAAVTSAATDAFDSFKAHAQ